MEEIVSVSKRRRPWQDLSLDILIKIMNGLSKDDLYNNVFSVCQSWQLACWHILCWRFGDRGIFYGSISYENSLDMRVLVPCLERYCGTRSTPDDHHDHGYERYLMKLLNTILEDNHVHGIYLNSWRLSIQFLDICKELQLLDNHFLYIAQRTVGILCLSLADATRITGKGFAEAICNWKNLKYIRLGNTRPEYFSQIIEEIGKACSDLEWLDIRADRFHLTKDNAVVIAKNLAQLKNLSFHFCYLYKDGVACLFANSSGIQKLQFSGIQGWRSRNVTFNPTILTTMQRKELANLICRY